MLKKIMALLAVLMLTFSSFSVHTEAASFSDLSDNHRFYEEMMYLEGEGIIAGYPDGTFRADQAVTRAAAAIMIGRALGLDGAPKDTKFPDVGKNQKASGYIASAVEQEIISGFPDGTYRPDEPVTRGQMAIFLSRAFNLKTEAAASFSDISPNMQAYVHIKRILAENITEGYPDNTYRPDLDVTRAQFSAFLERALNDDSAPLPEAGGSVTYAMNTNKVYHYSSYGGDVTFRYSGKKYENKWPIWDISVNGVQMTSLVNYEDSEGYYYGHPDSDLSQMMKYPVKAGESWNASLFGEEEIRTISSTTKTVKTPAGTFHNVVEVTSSTGIEYYAPNVGLIKMTLNDGEVVTELTKLTNR
ncbi:S-layer homology domain-containing protein [Bacillus thermotolerans]|uniref:SLH domain-containing protein n=1 Tax=Bacillus thermotolerans TaxID=1221996 RepID=A0A0F5I6L1_BACTR|nr:S-layer homology domain-containing protein [Bacillus thermotolerans]KKB40930.1 hypothetical protein QY95_00993 [Bacillus thermotolerans]